MTQPANTNAIIAPAPSRVAGYSDRQLKKMARAWREIDAAWLRRIAAAEHHGDVEKAKGLRRQHLSSISGVFVALEQDNARRKVRHRKNLRELVTIAEGLSPWRGTTERVRVIAKPKRNNQYRHICAYGTENRGLQGLLRRSVEAGAEFDPAQYSVRGRGGQRAIVDAVHAAIATGDYKYAQKFDIKDCFPSLTLDGIARTLRLPPKVVQNVAMVNIDAMDITYPEGHADHSRVCAPKESPRGIAQGSLASPTIANLVLKPLLEHVPASAFKAMWADDLIVLSRSKADAISIHNALCAAARQLPVGSLRLTHSKVRRLCDGIDFMGTRFRRSKGIATAEPSAKAKNQYTAKARETLTQPPSPGRDQAYRSLARGFDTRHRQWDGVEEWTKLRRWVVEATMQPDFKRWPKSYRWSCFMA